VANLKVLPGGPPSSDPLGLLSSGRLAGLLRELAKQAEVIIFDGPPILPAADAAVLASEVNGILLVLDAGGTTASAANEALESLGIDGDKVFGAVLNELRPKDLKPHDYRYLTRLQQ
jgi:Mrp family chromosome partitioning ATPase